MMLQRYSNGFFSDPLSLMENMRRQFDWVFGADPFFTGERHFATGPRFEGRNTEEGLVLSAELPGMTAEDVQVKVEDRTLTIEGRRQTPAPEGYDVLRKERTELSFSRAFTLGRELDPNSVEAEMKDGILTLRLDKHPEAQPKVIDVKAS